MKNFETHILCQEFSNPQLLPQFKPQCRQFLNQFTHTLHQSPNHIINQFQLFNRLLPNLLFNNLWSNRLLHNLLFNNLWSNRLFNQQWSLSLLLLSLELNTFLTKKHLPNMRLFIELNMFLKRKKSQIITLSNIKPNIFLKCIKINTPNTYQLKEFKKELNIRLLKDKWFTNQFSKSFSQSFSQSFSKSQL